MIIKLISLSSGQSVKMDICISNDDYCHMMDQLMLLDEDDEDDEGLRKREKERERIDLICLFTFFFFFHHQS